MSNEVSKHANTKAAFVYCVVSGCGKKVKIGSSLNPLSRIARLRRSYPDIDLERSVLLEVDSARLEFVLHYALADMRLGTSDDDVREGRTEWFDIAALDTAIHLAREIFRTKDAKLKITTDLLSLVNDHVLRYGDSGSARMSRAERTQHQKECHARALRKAAQHAATFIAVLSERHFDERLSFENNYYLQRVVSRHSEPEYFDPALTHERWINKLSSVHVCYINDPYFTYRANRIKNSDFALLTPSEGIETIDFGPFYSSAQGWVTDERVLKSEQPILNYLLTEYPDPRACISDPLPSVRILESK